MSDIYICAFSLWVIFGLLAMKIYRDKGGSALIGFIVGFVFGPLGIVLAMAARGNRIPCPWCRTGIDPEALVCPKCGRDTGRKGWTREQLEQMK